MTDKPTCSDIPWESEVGNHKKMVHYIQDTISGQVLLAVPVDLDVLAHFLSDLCYIYIEIVFPCLSDFFGLMLNVCSCRAEVLGVSKKSVPLKRGLPLLWLIFRMPQVCTGITKAIYVFGLL
jgi:hypothetical protein